MIVGINHKFSTIPTMILRTCQEQLESSCTYDSIFLTQFAKKYNLDGKPNFIQLTLDRVFDRVFVIEDFLELFELESMQKNLILAKSSLPHEWYGETNLYHQTIENRNLADPVIMGDNSTNDCSLLIDNHEHLKEDWAYIVTPFEEWHLMYTD